MNAMNDPQKILIVDDQLSARELLEAHLLGEGYEVAFAANGQEALHQVGEFSPDTILLDVMMPGMTGFEVCRHVKARQEWRPIPIILVTALESQEDLVQGLEAGADDFLSKPVNGMELRARVRSMLRIKRQYDELEAALRLNEQFARVTAQHLEALEILYNAGLQLVNNLDTDSVLALITQTAMELMPEATGCAIHFLSEDAWTLLPVVFSPEHETKMVYPSLGIEEIVKEVMATKNTIYLSDIPAEGEYLRPQLPKMRTLLVTPLVDHEGPVGTLSVYSAETDAFAENHRYILPILATQATVTIRKARFFEERARTKEQEKRKIQQLFQSYVSPSVVERLVDGQEDLALGGQRHEISVLFADVRGFTTFGEKLAPERLVEVLNIYLALAVEAILAEEGTLDKFMGDAVMAIFNAPLPQSNHTLRAVQAALAMQQAIAHHNSKMIEHQYLSFGIGIHVGPAVVGNIGTEQQMNYTAIGDTVNLAKRLQENANRGQIILSQAAYEAVREFITVEKSGPLKVKGREAVVMAYRLIGLRKTDTLDLNPYGNSELIGKA